MRKKLTCSVLLFQPNFFFFSMYLVLKMYLCKSVDFICTQFLADLCKLVALYVYVSHLNRGKYRAKRQQHVSFHLASSISNKSQLATLIIVI